MHYITLIQRAKEGGHKKQRVAGRRSELLRLMISDNFLRTSPVVRRWTFHPPLFKIVNRLVAHFLVLFLSTALQHQCGGESPTAKSRYGNRPTANIMFLHGEITRTDKEKNVNVRQKNGVDSRQENKLYVLATNAPNVEGGKIVRLSK